jgi:hypothetical protein
VATVTQREWQEPSRHPPSIDLEPASKDEATRGVDALHIAREERHRGLTPRKMIGTADRLAHSSPMDRVKNNGRVAMLC